MSEGINVFTELSTKAAESLTAACKSFESGHFEKAVEQLTTYKSAADILGKRIDHESAASIIEYHATDFLMPKIARGVTITPEVVAEVVQEMLVSASKLAAIEVMNDVRARKASPINGKRITMFGSDLMQLGELCRVGHFDLYNIGVPMGELNKRSGRSDASRFFVRQVRLPGA